MGQTVVEKIAQAYMAEGPARPLRAGDFVSVRPHHVMTHDNTAAVMAKFATLGAASVFDPRQPVFALDHDIQNTSEANLAKYNSIEAFARRHGVDFFPAGTGIGHQIMCEYGYVVPGAFVVASDSHSNMYGALGAVGTPVVRTDAAAIWATGQFWWQIPRTVQVVLEGRLPAGASGKDVIITLAGTYPDEVLNAAVEFGGPGAATLSVDERMSIANMTTEWGALVGWFPPDEVTVAWLKARHEALQTSGAAQFTEADLDHWALDPIGPDADAVYAARIVLDLAEVTPHVSGPDTVQVMRSVADMEGEGVPIQKAYLVSCVNSRLSDLEAAAAVLRGRHVAASVELYVAAASKNVEAAARESGIWQDLLEAGARPLPPGCGPCIGLGAGLLEPGEVGISATNRNFKGRMGSRDARCYLASPAVVAASAVAGRICAPAAVAPRAVTRRYQVLAAPPAAAETVAIVPGFPERVTGRLLYLPADNINTDGIYGKDYTYREDMTREMMARVVMANYDPAFAEAAGDGDIVVGGENFGTGSSREQAVTALQARGIALVVAASFSQTYLRNAFNNGFVCVECPALAARLRALFAGEAESGARTVIPGDELTLDFTSGTLTYRGERFAFPALGSVPQSLVVAGGVENLVRRRLAPER